MPINDDDTPEECPICGEDHGPTIAEKFFVDECEKRGLPTARELVHPKSRMIVTMSSIVLSPLFGMVADDPDALLYYACALRGLARAAEERSGNLAAEISGEVPDTVPDGWGSV